MELIVTMGNFFTESLFFAVYLIYISVLVSMIAFCVYLIVKVFNKVGFVLKDEDLFFKAGKVVGEYFNSKKLSVHDLIWLLELRGVLQVEEYKSNTYKLRIEEERANIIATYLKGFFESSYWTGQVSVARDSTIKCISSNYNIISLHIFKSYIDSE